MFAHINQRIATIRQEVLSLSSRLQAANAAALDALATLFPPELFPLLAAEEASAEQEPQQEQQEALEEGQQRGEEKASLLSVVAEEEEEEGAEAAPEAEAGAGQLEAMVEAVEQQLSELDAEEAGAVAVPAAPEAGAEDTETVAVEDEIEEDEAQPEQGPEEGEPMAPAGAAGAPDSPPSMSDLGLSHFTRRFILEAKKGSPTIAQGKAAGAACEKAAAGAAGISPTLSASPTSPPLPIEKRAAEAAAAASVMGTPVITMPTADGERAFPSPVFRTGVKLRHPPASGDARAPSSGPHSAKSSSSTNSSSLPSPQLFEPKSVDRVRKSQAVTGHRHALRPSAI